MNKPQFSYWVSIISTNGDSLDFLMCVVEAAQRMELLAPAGPLVYDTKETNGKCELLFRVHDDYGTIEQTTFVYECVEKLAKMFPLYTFTLDETNEENDADETRTVWSNGCVKDVSHARVIVAECKYDPATVSAIVTYLGSVGADRLADEVNEIFGNETEE